jgi:UDP-N-acetylmuramoyl-tripeptide--D-alanyl-D-alanine ligase
MTEPLWSWDALTAASGATADGTPDRDITGFSIDSRSLSPGDVFVALKDVRDGHDFVTAAFSAGASAAMVSHIYERRPGDGALLRVADPLAGLVATGKAARARAKARIVAVTGSVGKTGTKSALQSCLSRLGPTHAAEKSFNNHWGVPLTLARMPAAAAFGVFEIGMNHQGEIAPLARMVRPHVAVITTVEPVHIGHLGSLEAIAEEKSDIFLGLEHGGTAVINRDNPLFPVMERRAEAAGARILAFGAHPHAHVRLLSAASDEAGSEVTAVWDGGRVSYRLAAPGAHQVANSLAVVAALLALEADVDEAVKALGVLTPPPGRGARSRLSAPGGEALLIDESYNANPASMRAALATLGMVPRDRYPRRIAVLGDMLELGEHARELHLGLEPAIDAAGVDLVFACGAHMAALYDSLPQRRRALWAESSGGLEQALLDTVRGGDAIMVKGSLGSRMSPLVRMLLSRLGGEPSS